MGVPNRSALSLIERIGSWIYWGSNKSLCSPEKFVRMPGDCCKMGCECGASFTEISQRYHCQNCSQWLCGRCMGGYETDDVNVDHEGGEMVKLCKLCSDVSIREIGRKYSDKVHPTSSPRESPEPPSPTFHVERIKCFLNSESVRSSQSCRYLEPSDYGYSPHAMTYKTMHSFSSHPSPVSVRYSPSRSDEEETGDSARHFFSPTSDYFRDSSDIESSSLSARNEYNSYHSVGSSPSDSPARINLTEGRVGHSVQKRQGGSSMSQNDGSFSQDTKAVLQELGIGTEDRDNTDDGSVNLSSIQNQNENLLRPLDFENNGLIWSPPPPEDENDEAESNFFAYDDEDDDVGDSGLMFSISSSLSNMFPAKVKVNEGNKEPLRAVVQGHFRALVSQLLQGEGIKAGREEGSEDWLDIITNLAWQAANFVRPDTSHGGSMDPGDYVKVKCVAAGNPSGSTVTKGVVCTKNITHKRMTSQYRNPRLLLLGGALEFQRVPNQLASFETLLNQENDHLKMVISKIEALRPNVLLVEKSVSSRAQEYLLAKDISLVLNVKRSLLERMARCTGALITPSIDNISSARLGHCELFRLERVSEGYENANQFNKKPSKTLMYFEGCPRRLGCTVLLRGMCREELKKVKHVVQYAIFAAYHLSLETSFLADEGASLPKTTLRHSASVPDRITSDPYMSSDCNDGADASSRDDFLGLHGELEGSKSLSANLESDDSFSMSNAFLNCQIRNALPDGYTDDESSNLGFTSSMNQREDLKDPTSVPCVKRNPSQQELQEFSDQEKVQQSGEIHKSTKSKGNDENDVSSEYFSATDTHQSILVSFSSHCVLKGTVCERARLLRIKFYGCFDKPLGRYLRDDLFDQTSCCGSCTEPADAHVLCYTHQQGNLTINVRRLSSIKLPGEQDGKIWMWHRCLRCAHIDGVPPATRRVVMSDAAWGLSFGKFLELSFSNHATANRVATCGHSLQRDCLRYYGCGSMVAFFQYSPIDILSVRLPPSMLEFNDHVQQEWIRKEASELINKMETLYAEISDIVDSFEPKGKSFAHELSDISEVQNHIIQLKDLIRKERSDYIGLLQPVMMETLLPELIASDILELNHVRRSLLIGSRFWDRRLYSLDLLLKRSSNINTDALLAELKELGIDSSHEDGKFDFEHEGNITKEFVGNDTESGQKETFPLSNREEDVHSEGEIAVNKTSSGTFSEHESTLSERIDSAWSGTIQADEHQFGGFKQMGHYDNLRIKKLRSPVRVHSFDSALRIQERIRKGLPPSNLYLSTIRSFHASGDYRSMVRDPVSNVTRTYSSQGLPWEAQKLNLILSSTPSFISSASNITEGARLLLPRTGNNDLVIAVYDNDPTSIISYALSSREYENWVEDKMSENEGGWNAHRINTDDSATATPTAFSAWQSFGSLDLDYIHYGSYGSEDSSASSGTVFMDPKKSPHLRISFRDDSSNSGGKVKFSVTCYFAKQFDSLRKKCCPSEVDFVRSLSRCKRWSAQGGKSNVYFAKSLDERFIIKQVTKTELDSFEDFASEYFKYLSDSLSSGSPTCLAKILGIFQVTVKHLKGGKEMKMDLMVMENLFFKRRISTVYDLKGSARSRYNSDTTGTNKVLLDMNLLETLCTKPIFLGSKAKRSLERAIWNDTSFLASVDVMDYSLLVGVDAESKELVIGIIDFMRQYTWDKHLETWVKASGILGGPKNASPTIISPKQYKKRFRKAMTTYFLTVPDQWSS